MVTNDSAGDDTRPRPAPSRSGSGRRPAPASTPPVDDPVWDFPDAGAASPATEQIPVQQRPTPRSQRPRPTSAPSPLDMVPDIERPVTESFELPEIVPAEQAAARTGQQPAPVVRSAARPRVRRVTRVVRHIDTWSVFKVALVFHFFLYVVCLTAGVLLWKVADNTGTLDNVERFFESFGWETFELKGGEIYHNAWIAGLFVAIGLTGLAVLVATLFNLITDLVGGVRVSVLEEEVVATESGLRPGFVTEMIDRVKSTFR
jgi:hypothetical protein